MNFPISHPVWMFLYFGTFGTAGAVLFTLTIWYWMKAHALAQGPLRSALKWNAFGYMFLFFAAWFACGIGGPPGNLLSADPAIPNLYAGTGSALLSMFFSVPGWALVMVGQRKTVQAAKER